MPALTSILLGTALAASVAGTGAQIKNASDARSDAQAAAQKQATDQQMLIDEQTGAQKKQQQDLYNQSQAAITQSIARAAAPGTRGGTIVTSPLGIPGSAPTVSKSVLGS